MQGKQQIAGKTLAHGGNGYVSVQQRTDQSVGFSATNGHVPAGYDDSKPPFDASSMVHFRKCLTPAILAQINEMVIQEAQKIEDSDNQDDNKPDGGGNSGTMIVDATCAPSNIRYPQDVSLLNEVRENAEKLLDILHSPTDGKKPRTYRKRARKDYLKYVLCRKHTAKMTRKAIGK